MSPTKLTPDDVDWKKVIFKDCPVHTELRYASDKCPVCASEDVRAQLENQIASLEMLQATAAAE